MRTKDNYRLGEEEKQSIERALYNPNPDERKRHERFRKYWEKQSRHLIEAIEASERITEKDLRIIVY